MKRSAEQAFGAAPADAVFTPTGDAMLDPKAYFAQWQQMATAIPKASAPKPASDPSAADATDAGATGATGSAGPVDMVQQVRGVSAIRCAALVKEKGDNFTNSVAIEALHTMAMKSSFKLREELLKHPHVRRLCQRVGDLLRKPPAGLSLEQLGKAAWCLARFPDSVRGDAQTMVAPVAKKLLSGSSWQAETAVRILWSMARTDAIQPHKLLLSHVISEFVKDKCQRGAELSVEACIDLLFAISRARRHIHKGDHPTVRLEENDEQFFEYVGKRVTDELAKVNVRLLCDLANIHAEVGLRRELLFKTIGTKIVSQQQEVSAEVMGKVIKAYARFMIPLKAEQQGFRTLAIVAKGDFLRPSDKPKRSTSKQFDKPQPLFPKTQLHARA